MAVDHTLAMRQAVTLFLRATPSVTSLVPASRIVGPQVTDPPPQFPFIRYGMPITSQYEATRREGSEHAITIHVFANGPGEDSCANICAAVAAALDDAALTVATIGNYGIDWTGTTIIRDTPESSAYHGIVTFTARTFGL